MQAKFISKWESIIRVARARVAKGPEGQHPGSQTLGGQKGVARAPKPPCGKRVTSQEKRPGARVFCSEDLHSWWGGGEEVTC